MRMHSLRLAPPSVLISLIAGCALVPPPAEPPAECAAADPRIGQNARLRTYFHSVSGTARIVDDCTIEIQDFTYDGGGLDVRVYGARDLSFSDPVILSRDLRRPGGYRGATLTVKLPEGVTLDDVRAIAIWCVPADVNFGDGVFGAEGA